MRPPCTHPDLDAAGNCRNGCGFNSDVEHYAAIGRGEDVYGPVSRVEQCTGPVYNGSMSAPERCALWVGHEGWCEP